MAMYACVYVYVFVYHHPEVDRIWIIERLCDGSFQDHILSTPGWLYAYPVFGIYIYTYMPLLSGT